MTRTTQQVILTIVILLYAMSVIALSNTQWINQAYLISAIIITLSAYSFQARGAITTTIILLILHISPYLVPEFIPSTQPLNNWTNQLLLIAVAFTSTTYFERQKKLQRATASYDRLFEQSNDGVFILDLKGNHTTVNQRAVEMLGYDSKEELTSIGYREIVDPTQITHSDNVLAKLLAGERVAPYERVFRKKDGSKITVEINVQLITSADSKAKYLQSIVRDVSERKQRQEQLRLSEIRFRTFFEHSPVSIWEQDLSDVRTYLMALNTKNYHTYFDAHPEVIVECARRIKSIEVNAYTLRLFNAPDTNALRYAIFSQIKNKSFAYDIVKQHFTQLIEGQTQFDWIGSVYTLDGQTLELRLEMKIFPGFEDTWERVLLVITDITELKRAEIELKHINTTTAEFQSYLEHLHHLTIELGKLDTLDELYKAAVTVAITDFDFSRAAIFIADYQDNLLRGSYGTSPEGEIRPEHEYSEPLYPSDWFESVLENKNRVTLWENVELLEYGDSFATGWKAAAALWSGDDTLGYIVVDNYLNGKPPRAYEQDLLSLFSTTLGNLIARRRAVLLLEASQELLKSTFASLNDAIFVLDELTTEIEDCNDAALKLFGYTREELIGKKPHFITPEQSATIDSIEQLAQALTEIDSLDYYELHRKDGTIFYADIQISPLQSYYATTQGWVMVVHDMSERKIMEQKLINLALEKERVNTLQQLITNLRHDIATPLSTIKTSLYMLGKLKDEAKQAERILAVDKQVSIIQTTLEAVTEMTRMDVIDVQDLTISSVSLNILLANVHRDLVGVTQIKQQTFQLSTQSDGIIIQADESRLRAAIDHIVKNAIQFTPEGGSIHLSLTTEKSFAVITVHDSGIGISETDMIHIFDRLYRGQRHRPVDGRLGIGLPIAKRILELHGGRIEVESTIEVGSIFRVYLPLDN